MASAGVVASSPTVVPRGFYQLFLDALSFKPVSNDINSQTDSLTTAVADESRQNSADKTESLEVQKNPGGKIKSKFGKKKEIVSSSTAVPRLEVCVGRKCKSKGSQDLLAEFQSASNGRVEIAYTKCMKECKKGMNVRVTKDGTSFDWHHELSSEDVQPILCKHFEW